MAKAYAIQAELYATDGEVFNESLDTGSDGLPPLYAQREQWMDAEHSEMRVYKREGMTGDTGVFAGRAWVYREVEEVADFFEEVGHPYVDYSGYAKAVAGMLS